MIRYHLKCSAGHQFESWFRDDKAYEDLQAANMLSCAYCEDTNIDKALMAPAIGSSSGMDHMTHHAPEAQRKEIEAKITELRTHVETTSDYVGENFAEEARKIHYGEEKSRSIYGEVSREESQDLQEEGITCLPLPWSARRKN